jgi:hypothetical protein
MHLFKNDFLSFGKIHKQFNLKKMKKALILIAVVAFFACSRQQTGYEITVNLEGAEGQILLEKRGTSQWIPVDTADIVDGKAILKGEVSFPEDHYISVFGQRPKAIIFVENEKMTVTGNVNNLENLEVTGSETHNDYNRVNQQIQQIGEEYMALYHEARDAAASGDTSRASRLMQQVEQLYESTNTIQEDFIRNNPASYATPYFLSRIQFNTDVDELDKLASSLDPKLNVVPSVVALKDRIEKLKTQSAFPTFTNEMNILCSISGQHGAGPAGLKIQT